MRIAIQSIADKGDIDKERILLKVLADDDIGNYALIQTGFYNNNISIDVHNTYWFAYQKVKIGDLIVLYTKKGGYENTRELENGKNVHFYYWQLPKPIWSISDRAAVLLYAPRWESYPIPDPE